MDPPQASARHVGRFGNTTHRGARQSRGVAEHHKTHHAEHPAQHNGQHLRRGDSARRHQGRNGDGSHRHTEWLRHLANSHREPSAVTGKPAHHQSAACGIRTGAGHTAEQEKDCKGKVVTRSRSARGSRDQHRPGGSESGEQRSSADHPPLADPVG